jgi:GT2 family glycosyltransferase
MRLSPRRDELRQAVVPDPPLVRLVVLNYNGGELVVQCLEGLAKLDWPADRLEVVVVDNASTDGSDIVIAERFPGVRLVRSPRNYGFPANNLALRQLADVDYVGLVNPDSCVESGWLRALVGTLEADETLGAVSPRILFADRFVDVAISSPTFVPGGGDRRTLGVQVSGARVEGVDRWRDAQFAEGTWGIEHDSTGGMFQWTSGTAVVRLPVGLSKLGGRRPPAAAWKPGEDVRTPLAELRLAAEAPKRVAVRCGAVERHVDVGASPAWVEIQLSGTQRDIVNNVGSIVFDDGYGADRGFLEPDEGQYGEPVEVFAWCGGSVLLRPRYLADVGLFDERFFLYYEDTDLSWRGRTRGWRYGYVPEAVARHVHAASTGEGSPVFQHYVERNRLLMLAKNAPRDVAWGAVWRYLLVTLSYARRDIVGPVLRLHRPNVEQVRRRLASFAGFASLAPAMLRDRWRIRRRSTVGDDELRARFTRR